MRRTITIKNEMFKHDTNPVSLLNNAIQEVNTLFEDLTKNFPVSFSEYENFIHETDTKLSDELRTLWDEIDCDIYGRFLAGKLLEEEYVKWKKALMRWKKLTTTAIQEFAMKSFGQILNGIVSDSAVEIAA